MNPSTAKAFLDEFSKMAAAPPLRVMEKIVSRAPPSRVASLFPQLPFGDVWRRKTLADVAEREGLPAAVKWYRMALKKMQPSAELPLAERLKAFKHFRETGKLPRVSGPPRRLRAAPRTGAVEPIGGEGTVRLVSHGPKESLEAAVKDPASKLEPFYVPGRTRPAREGMFFWEGEPAKRFTSSPRSLGDPGEPAKLTLEIPRSRVFTTGKHKELHPLGERVVTREDLLRHAKNIKVEPL